MLAFNDPAAIAQGRREEARVEAQAQRTQRERLLQRVVNGCVATNRAIRALVEYEAQNGREVESLLDAQKETR